MKFVDMLSTIVDNIHSPDFIFNKIAELAPMHHRLGVRAAHMEPMGRLLLVVFDTAWGAWRQRRRRRGTSCGSI